MLDLSLKLGWIATNHCDNFKGRFSTLIGY
jgi:hypothetical protein